MRCIYNGIYRGYGGSDEFICRDRADHGTCYGSRASEYYVNPDTNQLVCVITDVTDKNHKQSLVVLMANQGLTLEEASERYSDTERFREKTEILSYDDSMTIEIPEVDILTAEDLMPTE